MRTLIDIAGCSPADVVEEALDDALRRKLVTVAQLQRRLRPDGAPGRSGTKLLRDLVDARAGVARASESTLETRLLRALRAAGLPKPVLQHKVGPYRVDFAYPEARVAIEADGFRWHSTRQQWDRDRARRNALTAMGWTLLHVTWEQLHQRRDEVIDAIRATLRGRP
jgi:very-short-patch-repair endonuclease